MTKFYSEWSGMPSYEFVDLRTERSAVPIGKVVKDSIQFKTPFYRKILESIQRYSIYIGLGSPSKVNLNVNLLLMESLLLRGERAFNL